MSLAKIHTFFCICTTRGKHFKVDQFQVFFAELEIFAWTLLFVICFGVFLKFLNRFSNYTWQWED